MTQSEGIDWQDMLALQLLTLPLGFSFRCL